MPAEALHALSQWTSCGDLITTIGISITAVPSYSEHFMVRAFSSAGVLPRQVAAWTSLPTGCQHHTRMALWPLPPFHAFISVLSRWESWFRVYYHFFFLSYL